MSGIMFDQSPFAIYWSVRNEESPENVPIKSHKEYKFDCTRCNHSFDKRLSEIKKEVCPYCVATNRRLCEDDDCTHCFNHSFASHPFSQYWDYENNNGVKPRRVRKGATEIAYKFNCTACGHKQLRTPDSLSKGKGCSYCSGTDRCESMDCVVCTNHSFASSKHSVMWSNKNILSARYVALNSNVLFKFCCNVCNFEFERMPKALKTVKGTACIKCRK
jgi:hypothetical protein